nr:immunoglobulin heavy chain junction region [Macaca mulatta]MOX93223.1 immunoglobulin heavy chain junction region [Macaca mulatta]MOX93286.1 immunoglobulin heavy chain junction region [Macaca mulatta]MOX93798.1 immunoglobulin heavy chain junction region [Macaca mulatta]MOX95751.1 immunoglobulin heavy chain junction region [Macaca mulatta]
CARWGAAETTPEQWYYFDYW